MKIVGFITCQSEVAGVVEAADSYQGQADIVLILGQRGLLIKTTEYSCRLLSDYRVTSKTLKRVTLWLDDWANRSVLGHSLKEKLIYRGTSLWWFFLPVLAPDVLQCFQRIEMINSVLRQERPDIVIVSSAMDRPMLPFRLKRSKDLTARLIQQSAQEYGCKVHKVKESFTGTVLWWGCYSQRRIIQAIYARVGYQVTWLTRYAITALFGSSKSNTQKNKLLLMSCNEYWRQRGNWGENPNDIHTASTVEILTKKSDWDVVDIDVAVNPITIKQCLNLRQKIVQRDLTCRPLESYTSFNCADRSQLHHLRDLWETLSNNTDFRDSLNCDGVSLWPVLVDRLRYLFTQYARIAIDQLAGAENLLEREKPTSVLIEYEEGSHGRAVTLAAREKGIPCVGLQHGLHAGPFVPAYFFREVNWKNGDSITACPIPTCTAVFGESTYDMLVHASAYPEDSVEIVGSPMHDDLFNLVSKLSQRQARHALGLQSCGSTITVLSSKFVDAEDHSWFAEGVLGAIRETGVSQCIIKLHPGEDGVYWKEQAHRLGIDNLVILAGNLTESIAAADFVVSWYSTTILDSLIIDRPVVLFASSDISLAPEFVVNGHIEIINDTVSLSDHLRSLLSSPKKIKSLLEQQRVLLEKELYSSNGMASHRLADLLSRVSDPHESTSESHILDGQNNIPMMGS
jgi:hypothetical protein